MNCVHSLWTGTPRFTIERGPLLVHTLSLCLAHEHFQHVELVTDKRGLWLAETLGWRYTSYLNLLDRLTAAGLTHVWAMGKLVAICEQGEPFVHIDSDVLLHQPLRRELRHARLVAQSIDYPHYYESKDIVDAVTHAGLRCGRVAYNCGVVGGCDLKLLHRYARESMAIAKRFFCHPLNGTSVSMTIEQYFLGDFARRHHTRVETVTTLSSTTDDRQRLGYDHLTGDSKRESRRVEECELRLAHEFPFEYARFLSGWDRLASEPLQCSNPAGSN